MGDLEISDILSLSLGNKSKTKRLANVDVNVKTTIYDGYYLFLLSFLDPPTHPNRNPNPHSDPQFAAVCVLSQLRGESAIWELQPPNQLQPPQSAARRARRPSSISTTTSQIGILLVDTRSFSPIIPGQRLTKRLGEAEQVIDIDHADVPIVGRSELPQSLGLVAAPQLTCLS